MSGWAYQPCTADATCYGGYGLCVDVDGAGPRTDGGCALDPASVTGPCTSPFVEVTARHVGGGDVTVCGNPNGACANGVCTTADYVSDCNDNPSVCLAGWVCNADGTCSCDGDSDCTSWMAGFVCHAGRCVCDSDDDCAASSTGSTCVQGGCGCSDAQDCTADKVCTTLGSFDPSDVD